MGAAAPLIGGFPGANQGEQKAGIQMQLERLINCSSDRVEMKFRGREDRGESVDPSPRKSHIVKRFTIPVCGQWFSERR
jgi:hypothetical protein